MFIYQNTSQETHLNTEPQDRLDGSMCACRTNVKLEHIACSERWEMLGACEYSCTVHAWQIQVRNEKWQVVALQQNAENGYFAKAWGKGCQHASHIISWSTLLWLNSRSRRVSRLRHSELTDLSVAWRYDEVVACWYQSKARPCNNWNCTGNFDARCTWVACTGSVLARPQLPPLCWQGRDFLYLSKVKGSGPNLCDSE